MSANSNIYTITDSSDSTPIISASDSREIILRNSGQNTVFFGFNGAVSTDSGDEPYGIYVQAGEYVVFSQLKANSDIYARCASGLTSTLMGEIK
jgi:hypothetical protein